MSVKRLTRPWFVLALAIGSVVAAAQAGPMRGGPPAPPQAPSLPAPPPTPPTATLPDATMRSTPPQVPTAPPSADARIASTELPPADARASTALDSRVGVAVDDGVNLPFSRIQRSRDLARQHPGVLALDRTGALVVRGQFVIVDPSPALLRQAGAAGFTVIEELALDGLDLRAAVLAARPGMSDRAALRRLRRLDPDVVVDFNHVYLGSAVATASASHPVAGAPAAPGTSALRVGLIDSGVDASHPALAGVEVLNWGCSGRQHPDVHGTAVASLLAGNAGQGPAVGELLAADIYCGQPEGGSVIELARALAWMAHHGVGVINISLVGPDNALLGRSVRQMSRRGHVMVSAVGNDGPTSPPLFPAAYEDVIGVTAIDSHGRVLPEAVRGPQARFAAPGAGLRAASPGGAWIDVRGTSYASPVVARLAATLIARPTHDATTLALAHLASLASGHEDVQQGAGPLVLGGTAANPTTR